MAEEIEGLGFGVGDSAESSHGGHGAGIDSTGLIEAGEDGLLGAGECKGLTAGVPLEGVGVVDGEADIGAVAEGLGHDLAEAHADVRVTMAPVRIGAGALGIEVTAKPAVGEAWGRRHPMRYARFPSSGNGSGLD